MFRATAGALPEAGQVSLEGIGLPAGRLVYAEEAEGAAGETPVAWVSDEVLDQARLIDLVRRLAEAFPRTGLWPVAASGLDRDSLERPWHDGELDGPDLETLGADDVLAGVGDSDEATVPFLGMADPLPGQDLAANGLEIAEAGGLLLVPVDRPADVPKAIGWLGPCNHDLGGEAVSAVLRSWEDRFGAVLVGLGFATLLVQVARCPESSDQIDLLVGEHYAFCPDNIDQGMDAADYRAGLPSWTHWGFWWD